MSNIYSSQLLASQDFFNRSTRVLDEADSTFKPHDGMMTVAQQVGHVAQTLDWFVEGASPRREVLAAATTEEERREQVS